MGAMNLDSIHVPLDLLPSTIAAGIIAVIILSGMVLFAIDSFRNSDRQFAGQVYGWLIVAGVFSIATAAILFTVANTNAIEAENANLQNGLKSAYGFTSSATIRQVEKGESVVVSGPRGNELVTLRKTPDQILVFRPDGTELPRVAQ